MGGGGGERVLWCALSALRSQYKFGTHRDVKIVIYTRSDIDKHELNMDEIKRKIKSQFGLTLPTNIDFELVFVDGVELLEASRYVDRTML
jgi:hypothetical protein